MQKDQEEKKYPCRLCNKSFPNGRTLGGHMRGHLAANSPKEGEKHSKSNVGYALRENPKKSWKFSRVNRDAGSTTCSVIQESACKTCGKEFESMRALFGHMRHHSGKDKKGFHCKESRTSSSNSLIVESLTDSSTVNLARKKRSRRMRYKNSPTSSFSSFNESSSVTEIEEEVEDVANCLMMLSEGVGNWGGFNFVSMQNNLVSDSPGNVSLTFEAKSLDHNKGIHKNDSSFACDDDRSFRKRRTKEKLGSCVSDSFNVNWEKKANEWTEFGVGIERKKLELEVSMEICRGLKMPNLSGNESGFVMYDTEIEKKVLGEMKLKSKEGEVIAGLESVKSSSCKDAGLDYYDSKLGINSFGKTLSSSSESGILDDSLEKREFRCKICNKVFHSYQALGGHQTLHRTNKACISLKIDYEENPQPEVLPEIEINGKCEAIENSVGQEINGGIVRGSEVRESKEHKCPVCFKLFTSGQALGGHKRAHHSKNSKTRREQVVMQQDFRSVHRALDLNLPAIVDEEGNGEVLGSNECEFEL